MKRAPGLDEHLVHPLEDPELFPDFVAERQQRLPDVKAGELGALEDEDGATLLAEIVGGRRASGSTAGDDYIVGMAHGHHFT